MRLDRAMIGLTFILLLASGLGLLVSHYPNLAASWDVDVPPWLASASLGWLLAIGLSVSTLMLLLRQHRVSLAAQRAQRERDRFHALFERNADALLLFDEQGRPAAVNERGLSRFGYELSEFLGTHLGTLCSGEAPHTQRELLGQISRSLNGEELCFDWQVRSRDRQTFWVECRMRSLLVDGQPHVLASLHDISARRLQEQKQLQTERRLRTLCDQIPSLAVMCINQRAEITFWSEGAHALYGCEPEQALGQPLPAVLESQAGQLRLSQQLQARLEGQQGDSGVEECLRRHSNGRAVAVMSRWYRDCGTEQGVELCLAETSLQSVPGEPMRGESAMHLAAEVALDLLRNRDTSLAVAEAISRIGQGLRVDRVYLVQIHGAADGVGLLCSWRELWQSTAAAGWLQRSAAPVELPVESQIPNWLPELQAGRSINGSSAEQAQPERGQLETRAAQSVLAAPIEFDGNTWGYLAIESVVSARVWQAVDERVLHIVGSGLAAAIERRRAEKQLRQNAKVFEATHDAVMVTDLDGNIVAVNSAFCLITGYGEIDVIGHNPRLLQSGRQDHAFFEQMWRGLLDKGHWRGEVWNRRKNGEVYPQWLDISTVLDDRGKPSHYVAVATDISQLKRSEQQLEHLAHHDPLTGLPNRLLAYSRLEHAIEGADRKNTRLAVLFVDLDGFKRVNDSLGHSSGDALLIDVANRLRHRVRGNDTLARLGGDEFLVIAEDLARTVDAEPIARKLIKALELPFYIDGREVFLGASIGVSRYPGDGNSSEELMRNADTAMYQAKASGRNQTCYFTADMNAQALALLELDSDIRNALQWGKFELQFQAKYDLRRGAISGFEALLRMRAADGTLVPPDRFISMAERTGTIVPIGAWVLRTACEETRRWQLAGHPEISVAVNVSPRQFRDSDWVSEVRHALDKSGLPAESLELELTETLLMDDPENMAQRMRELKALGVRLALDDFGTGFSSLGYLLRLPIDTLKIDQSFVATLGKDSHASKIIISIVDLARRMRLKVVAEGVETEAQANFLRSKQCDEIQGYLISRPVDGDKALALLENQPKLEATRSVTQSEIQGI